MQLKIDKITDEFSHTKTAEINLEKIKAASAAALLAILRNGDGFTREKSFSFIALLSFFQKKIHDSIRSNLCLINIFF